MLETNVLQLVPGTSGVEVFPFIRKIDLMSSNSYILAGKEQIALIDPGALDDQMDYLFRIITAMFEENPRQIIIYLTHVHLDHCFQLKRIAEFGKVGSILLAVQEKGALALETEDAKMTLAKLLGRDLARVPVDIKLLSKKDTIYGKECSLQSDTAKLTYFTKSFKLPLGPVLNYQTVSLNKDDMLEIYHTPGHSPDSICIRAGRLLFVGDLFFAPNPGMAGAYGWSQTDFLHSIQKVLWILKHKDIHLCCCGHGRAIDVDMAYSSLGSMYQDVLSLTRLEEITPLWVRDTSEYAQDIIRELERLLTILIGRLAYISQVLYYLEETNEADYLQSLLDARKIDELFLDFNRFVIELRAGKKLDWDLVHKAGQIVGRLDMAFESGKLASVLDQSLLNRAKRMLNDYSVIYRGFRPTFYVADVDINEILKDILRYAGYKPYKEEEILEACSYKEYVGALRSRIAFVNIFNKTSLQIQEDLSLPKIRMDRERFIEAVIDILERLICAGAERIVITPSYNDGLVAVRISLAGHFGNHTLDAGTIRFFERTFALCGGFIQTCVTQEEKVVIIEFLPCKMF
jgi:glyoxylase-like metal-dependent hydrolase (beta-lactamase superfamily II)